MGFELMGGRMTCYAPPIDRAGWLARFGLLERAGDRWWALGGGVYLIHAVKRVHSMRVLLPKRDAPWRQRPVWAQSTRTSTRKSRHERESGYE